LKPTRAEETLTDDRGDARTMREWRGGMPLPPSVALAIGLGLPATLLALAMWRVRAFTVDDAYISFRYARNLARGDGLVYNPGERVEGYTNFLFTLLVTAGIRLGASPVVFAKVLGALSAFGCLGCTYFLAGRLQPFRTLPCVATWLLATSVVFSGHSVFGLETSFFIGLVLLGTLLVLRETDTLDPRSAMSAFPWSGVVFGLAALTRPEAPMFAGVLMLFLGRGIVGRQNLARGGLLAAIVVVHLLWRHAYYGAWSPNTLSAKTGDLGGQLGSGSRYLWDYMVQCGSVLWLGLFGLAIGLATRRRDVLAVAALALAVCGEVFVVGGDWIPDYRMLAPFEPLCFLLIDLGARTIADRRDLAANLALAVFTVFTFARRRDNFHAAEERLLGKDKPFWDRAAGGTARWLLANGQPGEIALGDIGRIGYETDYPVLDLLGLVDPVIAKLPGGYTRKLGPGFNGRFFEKMPTYFLLISSSTDCDRPSVPGSRAIYNDPRFLPAYDVAGTIPLDRGFAWCIYRKR
jgi:arabinofuranosyltransferase